MLFFSEQTVSHKYYYLPLLLIGAIFISIELGKENFGFKNPITTIEKAIKAVPMVLNQNKSNLGRLSKSKSPTEFPLAMSAYPIEIEVNTAAIIKKIRPAKIDLL